MLACTSPLGALPHLVSWSVLQRPLLTGSGRLCLSSTCFWPPCLPACLQVRAAFYSAFEGVCPSLGPEGVAAIVLPFLDRLVGDPDAAVVAEAVRFLGRICTAGLLRKRHALLVAARLCSRQMLGPAAPTPVRAAAVEFLAAVAGQLSVADVQALLLPLALPHLAAEPLSFKVRRSWSDTCACACLCS